MRGNKKRKSLKFFALLAAFTCAACVMAFTGCKDEETGGENTLTFEVAAEIEAAYGKYFMLEDMVAVDSNNKYYFPKVNVTDSEGEKVIVEDGKFFAGDIDGYVITYSVEFGGETKVKTTNVKVLDKTAPAVKLEKEVDLVKLGTNYVIPAPAVSDDLDAADKIKVEYAVTFGEESIDLEDNAFNLSKAGDYKVIYSATDAAGNKTQKTLTVSSVNEEGNVSYFNHRLGASTVREGNYLVSSDNEFTYGEEDYSLKLTPKSTQDYVAMNAYTGAIALANPFIKDISAYNYMYYYVYSTRVSVDLYIDNTPEGSESPTIWESKVHVEKGEWQRVLFTKDAQGRFIMGNAHVITAETPANYSDITGLGLRFLIQRNDNLAAGTDLGYIYLSTMRVSNEIPVASVEFNPGAVFPGTEIDIPVATGTGFTSISTKAFVMKEGGEYTEVVNNKFTPDSEGNYFVRFDVYDGGKLVEKIVKQFNVIAREDGVVAYFHRSHGMKTAGVTGNYVSAQSTPGQHLPGEEYSLYVEVTGFPYVKITNPAIKNLNEKDGQGNYKYNYLYFWATSNQNGTKVNINSYSDNITLSRFVWTRIVAVRDGETFKLNGRDIFASGDAKFPSTASDITGLAVTFTPNNWEGTWLSSIRAVKTLPSIEKEFAPAYGVGGEIDVSATVSGATVKVYKKNGEELVEYTESTFIPTAEGVYTFVYEAYKDGIMVDRAERKVNVFADVTGLVTPFNYGYGVGTGDIELNNFTASASQTHVYGTEANALKLTPTADALAWYQNAGSGNTITGIVRLNAPLINDISLYKYMYFYVYSPVIDIRIYGVDKGTDTTNYVDDVVNVPAGTWKRVVYTRVDSVSAWYFNSNAKVMTIEQSKNLTGFAFRVYGAKADNPTANNINDMDGIYISAIRVANELPA